jgi:hypothetical protein
MADKTLKLELPITEHPRGVIFLAESWATGSHNGWEIEVDRTGRKVVLHLNKGEERLTQSFDVADLINAWVESVLGKEEEGRVPTVATPVLPLPTERFMGGTVIASVWGNDDPEFGPPSAVLLMLRDRPGLYYEVLDISFRGGQWLIDGVYPGREHRPGGQALRGPRRRLLMASEPIFLTGPEAIEVTDQGDPARGWVDLDVYDDRRLVSVSLSPDGARDIAKRLIAVAEWVEHAKED